MPSVKIYWHQFAPVQLRHSISILCNEPDEQARPIRKFASRIDGDLMLTILETLKENGIEIPFPQREVRILTPQQQA